MIPRGLAVLLACGLILFGARAAGADDKRLKWDKKWGPLVPHTKFPRNCSICHVPKRWDVIRKDFHFDHEKETGYPLLGAHQDAACLRCHNDRGPLKAYLARGCSGCHVDPHKGTLGLNCTTCHDQTNWTHQGRSAQKIADHARTRFPLTGMHASIQCQQCHLRADAGEFAGAPVDCISCHQKDYQSAPNHVAQNFPQNCQSCHTTTAFAGAHFNHGAFGAAALTCVNCHQGNFQSAPNHVALNYSQVCQNCHNTTTWAGANFNHQQLGPNPVCITCHQADFNRAKATPASNHTANGFPTTCQNCHVTTSWGPGTAMQHSYVAAAACNTCHSGDFASAKATPASNHAANAFPTACQNCHNTTAFGPGTAMQHSFVSGSACSTCHMSDFTMAKATPASNHAANGFPTTCQNCHTTTIFGPGTAMQHSFVAAAACFTCHSGDFSGAPNHVAMSFSHNCQTCHTGTTTWLGAVFDHSTLGANPVCYNCHATEYARAKSTPASNHAANGFPTTCQNCHTYAAWGPGTAMQHSFVSASACSTCHMSDFTMAKATPASNHAANGFPTTCQNCHNTTAFGPGTAMQHQYVTGTPCFACHVAEYNSAAVTPASNHKANGFPTTSPACQTCHTLAAASFTTWAGVVMTGSSADHALVGGAGAACQTCHMGEYNTTNNPTHSAVGFMPGQCSGCHGATTNWSNWLGAQGSHPPGASCSPTHMGASCVDCHTGGNYAACSCAKCHGTGQTCGTLPTNTFCPPN